MYDAEILVKAYFSVIKLSDKCTSTDETTLSNLYHLMRFVRSSIRDFPQDNAWLNEFKTVLDICSARLRKRVGKKLRQYVIARTSICGGEEKERIHSPFTNAYCAIGYFIRQKLESKESEDFLTLYKIADLYMQYLVEYSNKASSTNEKISLCIISSNMRYYIGWLESAMKAEGIKFDEIKV